MTSKAYSPKWSILLPTHNRVSTLRFAISSALIQTVQDFELLVVGDGCTDETKKLIESFNDNRIRYFDLPKGRGFGYANRNIALREARGRYVAFLADDDLWLTDHLEILGREIEDYDLVYTKPLWITPEGMIFPTSFNLKIDGCLKAFLGMLENALPAGCFAYKRSVHEEVGYWDESLEKNGDWDLWKRIIIGQKNSGEITNGELPEDNDYFNSLSLKIGFIEKPTNLHFRAPWKGDHNEGHKEMKLWRDFLSKYPFPESLNLKLESSAEILEQEVVFNHLKDPKIIKNIRSSISTLYDQFIFCSLAGDLSLNQYHRELNNYIEQYHAVKSHRDELERFILEIQKNHENQEINDIWPNIVQKLKSKIKRLI